MRGTVAGLQYELAVVHLRGGPRADVQDFFWASCIVLVVFRM